MSDEAKYFPTRRARIIRFSRQIGPAGPTAVLATLLPILGTILVGVVAPIAVPWMREHGLVGMASFIIAFTILGGFAIAPSYANSLLGGWTFRNFDVAFPVVMTALAGAATISFLLAKRISGDRVVSVIHEHPRWELVKDTLIGRGTLRAIWMVMLVRLAPILPFATTTVVLASLRVRFVPFLIGTLIGIAPRTAAAVFISASARQYEDAESSRWLLAASIAAPVIGAVIIALAAKHALHHATKRP